MPMIEATNLRDRIFCGVFPTGWVWADRCVLQHGDYKRLAYLSFAELESIIEPSCPRELLPLLVKDINELKAMRGQEYQVSTSGQTVTLGYGVHHGL